VLFGGTLEGMSAADLMAVFADVPSSELPVTEVVGSHATRVAAASGLCKSSGEARRLADGGGLYINNERVGSSDIIAAGQIIDDQLLLLRSGRKNYHLVKLLK
jgi:tyrosyl-tRNA synthetase